MNFENLVNDLQTVIQSVEPCIVGIFSSRFPWNLWKNEKIFQKPDSNFFILYLFSSYEFCDVVVNLKNWILRDFIFIGFFCYLTFQISVYLSESFKWYCKWMARNVVYTIDFQHSVLLWWFSYVLYLGKRQFVRAFCLIKGKYLKRPMAFYGFYSSFFQEVI